jgi:hypothetical protein
MLPCRVPEHDHSVGAAASTLVWLYYAAEDRPDIEQPEVVAGDPADEHPFGPASLRCEAQETDTVAGNVLKEVMGSRAVILEIRERHAAKCAVRCVLTRDYDEPVAVSDGQWPQDDRVHNTEDGGIDTDTKGERQYHSSCEDW